MSQLPVRDKEACEQPSVYKVMINDHQDREMIKADTMGHVIFICADHWPSLTKILGPLPMDTRGQVTMQRNLIISDRSAGQPCRVDKEVR